MAGKRNLNRIEYRGKSINLNEALETCKSLNEQIGELHTQVVDSAYEKIIYELASKLPSLQTFLL